MDAKTKQRAKAKMERMDQFIAYSDEFLVQEKVDGLHQGITVKPDDYLGNSLNLIQFWRKFYYNRLREPIDPKSWVEHSLVTVVNAFYNPGQNNMEFPAGILQVSISCVGARVTR
jgi:endothelin-converting enzyme/putative endopeptidase